ncbi:MAG: SDR family oxidoreductase [Acidimicrobiales bacterium]|nr:SDR family oxidoreductase [Acidimicrobiales bacterium]
MAKHGLGLEGKRTLVVGAGSGIGEETALLLARCGAAVAAADLDPAAATRVCEAAGALGVPTASLSGDVTVEPDAVRLISEAHDALGGLDAVVNIVGFAAWANLMELDDATWELDIRRNLTHHLYLSRAAARRWIDDGTTGAIAAVASVSGMYGAPNHAAYGAAKAGLIDLVRTMAQEWGPHGIRVNAVSPDMIATPRVRAAQEAAGNDMDQAAIDIGSPLRRAGQPDEIAGPLVFLVSDLSSFMTGQTLVADGGTMAAFPHLKGTTVMPRGG